MHHCGPMREWHKRGIIYDNLKSSNFGNPEMHDLKKEYPLFKDKKISVVGWGNNQPPEFIEDFLKLGIKTGVTLAVNAQQN